MPDVAPSPVLSAGPSLSLKTTAPPFLPVPLKPIYGGTFLGYTEFGERIGADIAPHDVKKGTTMNPISALSCKTKLNTKLFFGGALSLVLSFGLLGCSGSSPTAMPYESGFLDGLYSTRPQVDEPFITIISLKNPALLPTSKIENGQRVVDLKLAAAIKAEQEATIAELQKISPKIRVLIRYRLVLNALAIWGPADTYEKIQALPNVTMQEKAKPFGRPALLEASSQSGFGSQTSVKFIGAEAAYAQNIRGEGMRIGVLDTGIDYTHKMFLGEGTVEAYKAIDPNKATPSFPNKKVTGGIDLVGTKYNSSSPFPEDRVGIPDENPIDEATHGTHVAGTVAGIGDGTITYSGVAPEAELYAIKVFGAKGSTSDEIVIAGLEYAADPTGDLSFKNQLDVVNLSLGSSYDSPRITYNRAIKNLVAGGTLVVASAGNAGDEKFIVGAPSVSDDAISVASSVDNMKGNIEFPAAEFTWKADSLKTEFVEGDVTKPLSQVTQLQAELVDLGLADAELSPELKAQVQGKIALIARGKVPFLEKIQRAQAAGAIGVVMTTNDDGLPIVMGGEGKADIPGVMITKKAGETLRAQMASEPVTGNLKTSAKVEKPWLADTISEFSSRGPRSEDGLIKPEITSPGSNIISAASGTGDKAEALSGTSMAGPHIAGVMALLKQKYPSLNPQELRSVLMGHAKIISDADKKTYSVSRQGAGRVQIEQSLKAKVTSVPSALSFGITDIEKQKTLSQQVTLRNISSESLILSPEWLGSSALKIAAPSVTLAAGETKTITVRATIVASEMKQANDELEGFLQFKSDKALSLQIPTLVVARQVSQIKATALTIQATSAADGAGSDAELELINDGQNKGTAYLFNLLGVDSRKPNKNVNNEPNRNCDLQSAGYRIVEKEGKRILQVAAKLYEGMTTWNRCEVNVQIDSNDDNKADQEIAGIPQSDLPGLTGDAFISLLLDGNKARQMRAQYEADLLKNGTATENYSAAVLDQRKMIIFDNSTLAIIEADISLLSVSNSGELNLKVSTTHQDSGASEYDDNLGTAGWMKISTASNGQSYTQLPEAIELEGKQKKTISIVIGYGLENLIIYTPQNRSVRDVLLQDNQSQVVLPTYLKL